MGGTALSKTAKVCGGIKGLACVAALLLGAACAGTHAPPDAEAHAREVAEWQAARHAELASEGGWLTLVGLFWLEEGESSFGSGAANRIRLPAGKAPETAGTLRLEGGRVRLEAAPDSGLTHEGAPATSLELRSDADGQPTVLQLGTLTLTLIKRGGKLALRVRDKEHPDRASFRGLEFFPVRPEWRVEARLERFDPPRSVPIVNVLGMEEAQASPGALVFDAGGRTLRLDALSEGDKLFIIFADETSGRETYGAGRYLYAAQPDASGRVVLDFNKAFSPPCAYTDFATCPLPPPQNRLALRVEAGEKYAEKHARKGGQ